MRTFSGFALCFLLLGTMAFALNIVVIVGPPGSGKGTQTCMLRDALNWKLISPSGILRQEKISGTKLGEVREKYRDEISVKDIIKFGVAVRNLSGHSQIDNSGIIFDSWPKSPGAIELAAVAIFKNNNVLVIELVINDDSLLQKRVMERKVCTSINCGRSYGEKKEKVLNLCDNCGQTLIKRTRDNLVDFPNRIKNYKINSQQLLKTYAKSGIKVHQIDGTKSPQEVHNEIQKIMNETF